jgi:UDP-N-acetylglucosamine 2-epimerase (non-hydrolysing)
MRSKIMLVLGTRPEMIKLGPLIRLLSGAHAASFETHFVHSGQHPDMLLQAAEAFGLVPDATLQTYQAHSRLCDLNQRLALSIGAEMDAWSPDVVIVQGDTATALMAAQQAFFRQCPLLHIEAGLRSHDLKQPFPEEGNRCMISAIASFHCAPTPIAAQALMAEGVPAQRVGLTGNTGIDALLWVTQNTPSPAMPQGLIGPSAKVLVTMHRRESWGDGVSNAAQAIATLARQYPLMSFVFPLHPNPVLQAHFHRELGAFNNVRLCSAMAYTAFIREMQSADLLLTDSGGLQEEGIALHKPVLIMRQVTERPEALATGGAELVGTDSTSIVQHVQSLIDNPQKLLRMQHAPNPFGDGRASERIVQLLLNWKDTGRFNADAFDAFMP